MTLFAFVLVFASVFLHVAWNFISKSTKPSLAFYMLMSGTAALIWLPFFLTSDLRLSSLPLYFFLFYLGSVASEVMYVAGLAYAYRRGDISLVYPLVRAIPVLLVAAVTILFGLGRTPGRLALLGMLIITLGCILMPLKRFRDFKLSNYMDWIIIFILLGAVGTTGYTILDSSAMNSIGAYSHGELIRQMDWSRTLLEFEKKEKLKNRAALSVVVGVIGVWMTRRRPTASCS